MTVPTVSTAFDAVLAALLIVVIYFAIRLSRRMEQLRAREAEMQQLIASFNRAAAQAATSAASLRAAGADAEKSLRGSIEKAQALRDELRFIIDRGDRLADRAARFGPAQPSTRPPFPPARSDDQGPGSTVVTPLRSESARAAGAAK